MIVLPDHASLRAWRAELATPARIGLVPTMGALHAGHEALVTRAVAECEHTVVSVFVNPLQFDERADFEAYPRTLERDCAILERCGASAVYAPSRTDVYPEEEPQQLEPGLGGSDFEGACRPGHFAGVLTVVRRLFERVRPTRAYFGEKDAQQLFLVTRMVAEHELPLEMVPCATVREPDGLALSSRNVHLNPTERARGLALYRSLSAAHEDFQRGERDPRRLETRMREVFSSHAVEPEYAAVVDDRSFLCAAGGSRGPWRAVTAARVGCTRLIDNLFLGMA